MASEQRRVCALPALLQDRDVPIAPPRMFPKAYQAIQREDAKALDDPARWLTGLVVNTCSDGCVPTRQIWRRRPRRRMRR
jgi:hypothetical protein